jgi:hypothetical protein
MAAVAAHIFCEAGAARDESNPVPEQHAVHRMMHLPEGAFGPQERVPAKARVLEQAVPSGDALDLMPEQAAEIADLLAELRLGGIRIAIRTQEQRMPALHADVFVAPVAIREPSIRVMAQEAGERVADARVAAVFREVCGSAAATAVAARGALEHAIVDRMTHGRAHRAGQP